MRRRKRTKPDLPASGKGLRMDEVIRNHLSQARLKYENATEAALGLGMELRQLRRWMEGVGLEYIFGEAARLLYPILGPDEFHLGLGI